MSKQVTSFLSIYKREKGEKRFSPMCPISFKRMKTADFIYSWDGIISTFVKIALTAEENRRILGDRYTITEYQVRDCNGNIYATRVY
jgi:hypothetical protein